MLFGAWCSALFLWSPEGDGIFMSCQMNFLNIFMCILIWGWSALIYLDFFFQLKRDALASESVTSNKKRKTCTDPAECEENMCSVSTPDNISTVTTDTTQVDEMELCAPSTSGETLCTPVTDLASNSSAPDGTCTTASLSTPSATPLTSRQASVASSQSCKGCTHAVKYQSLQKANKRLKAQVKELKKTITELRSVSTLCIFI